MAVIATGGGGACVSLIGVARAFEEAGIEPASLTACSGGAIWGSMWAAGMSAHEMADFSLSWRPEDYLDIQWRKLPRLRALARCAGSPGWPRARRSSSSSTSGCAAMRGRRHADPAHDDRLQHGPRPRRVLRHARARPSSRSASSSASRSRCRVFIEAVPVGGPPLRRRRDHRALPGGAGARGRRLRPRLRRQLHAPAQFEPEDITGWQRPTRLGILRGEPPARAGLPPRARAPRQRRLGDKLTLIDPVDYRELRGVALLRPLHRPLPLAAADPPGL